MTLTNSEIIAVTLQKRKKKLANLTQCKRPRGAVAVVSFWGNKVTLTCRRREMCRNQLQLSRLPTSNIDTLFVWLAPFATNRFRVSGRLRLAGWLTPGAPLAPWLRYGASRRRRLELPVEDIQQQSNPRFCPVHVNVKRQHAFNFVSQAASVSRYAAM